MSGFTTQPFDIVLHFEPGLGYLPIVVDHRGEEIYRGEYKPTVDDAVQAAFSFLRRRA